MQETNSAASEEREGIVTPPVEIAIAGNSHEREDGGIACLQDGEIACLGESSTTDVPVIQESIEERRQRKRSHYVIYFTSFIMSTGFSIVLTGIWPYLKQLEPSASKTVLGWVVAANPLGQILFSPLMGLWVNKFGSVRIAFLTTVFVYILGNVAYSLLSTFGKAATYIMAASRFTVGLSTANIAICRAYISISTKLSERTAAVSLLAAAQALGFILGPSIQTALAVAFESEVGAASNDTNSSTNNEDFYEYYLVAAESNAEWNMYTAAGWVAVLMGIINFILFMPCIFTEHPVVLVRNRRDGQDTPAKPHYPKPDSIAIASVLLSFFVVTYVFVVTETVMVPMCIDLYAWKPEFAVTVVGIALSIAGVVAMFTFAGSGVLSKLLDERKVYISGLVIIAVGMVTLVPIGNTLPTVKNCTQITPHEENISLTVSEVLVTGILTDSLQPDLSNSTLLRHKRTPDISSENQYCPGLGCPSSQQWCLYTPIIELPQLAVGGLLCIVGYSITFTLSNSIYSKVLGPKPQGVWMGILTSAGGLSRMTGPVFVTYMYMNFGPRWTFLFLFIVIILTTATNVFLFKHLVPMKVETGEQLSPLRE